MARPKKKPGYNRENEIAELIAKAAALYDISYDDREERPADAATIADVVEEMETTPFSDEGLAAMSDVKDMTSQMAKELMLGIRDNVEDIAAAYKRMAIINPDRSPKQEEVIIEEPAFPEEPAVNIPTPRQTVSVELLEKTEESKPKRSKKPAILEDQLSIFDLVA